MVDLENRARTVQACSRGRFIQIDRKGTVFCAHSKIKCTKSVNMCTKMSICAIHFI